MGLLWWDCCRGIAVVGLLWWDCCDGIAVGLLWDCSGIALVLLMNVGIGFATVLCVPH